MTEHDPIERLEASDGTYSQFMHGVKLAGIELDRKAMADLAMNEAAAFKTVIAQAKSALPA